MVRSVNIQLDPKARYRHQSLCVARQRQKKQLPPPNPQNPSQVPKAQSSYPHQEVPNQVPNAIHHAPGTAKNPIRRRQRTHRPTDPSPAESPSRTRTSTVHVGPRNPLAMDKSPILTRRSKGRATTPRPSSRIKSTRSGTRPRTTTPTTINKPSPRPGRRSGT